MKPFCIPTDPFIGEYPMPHIQVDYRNYETKRFMRSDADRFFRSDWRRFVSPGQSNSRLYQFFECFERKFSAEQPRVPRGSPGGGQWTSDGTEVGRTDPRVLSDATPDPAAPGSRYAQNRPRGGFASVTINGQQVEPTPGQQARLAVVEAQARDALRRVQELDPRWQPQPSVYESVEGLIGSYQADLRQAQDRISDLQRVGIGPGPFAGESIPARGPGRDFTSAERKEINRIGSESGCHTCGIEDPGTLRGNFVPDHQPPNALNQIGRAQRLYPQCISCSDFQGGWIRGNARKN
jgi:hypothetical protein